MDIATLSKREELDDLAEAMRAVTATTDAVTGEVTFVAGTSSVRTSSDPVDRLATPIQHVDITAAISTTVVASATATGTYYRARVAWNNNGASASAKLDIAVNCTNDVHGLSATQNAKRRDHQMTMGDAVILVCSKPITTLHFSSDTPITINTHVLSVTFGN